MKRRLFVAILALLFLSAYFALHSLMWENRKQVRRDTPPGYSLPSKFSRILAVGNKGLLADFLFLKTSTFFGERLVQKKELSEEDWRFIIQSLDVVTDLDPYFLDPYVFSQGVLAWDAGKPEEAIRIMEKGFKHNPKQWRLAFYIGFNYYYFLGDYSKGADYISQAAQVAGSHSFLKDLAARLYYYGKRTRTAILFLKDMLLTNRNPAVQARLTMRLQALENAAMLEDALEKYRTDLGKDAVSLNDLVNEGYLEHLPADPYGGEWIIINDGRVFSTSKFVEMAPAEN